MSGRESSTMTATVVNVMPSADSRQGVAGENYHPDFNSPTADFVVRSCDGVRFKCHRLFLQESSPGALHRSLTKDCLVLILYII